MSDEKKPVDQADDQPVEKADDQPTPVVDRKPDPAVDQAKTKASLPGSNPEVEKDPTKAAVQHGATTGDNLPAAPGAVPEPEVIGERRGMFGAGDIGDTSGYGGLRRPILFPGAAQRPYGGWFDELADSLERGLVGGAASFAEAVEKVVVDRGELTMHVRREHLRTVARVLRDDPALRFEICTGVSGVNYPAEEGRELHAVYHFLSITHGSRRLRVEVSCPDGDAHIPSIVSIYPAADWHERETWDMFGIEFDGHPSLTRILMPDDWPGHPQRKDYPLGGIPVEYKGATVPPPDQRRSYN